MNAYLVKATFSTGQILEKLVLADNPLRAQMLVFQRLAPEALPLNTGMSCARVITDVSENLITEPPPQPQPQPVPPAEPTTEAAEPENSSQPDTEAQDQPA